MPLRGISVKDCVCQLGIGFIGFRVCCQKKEDKGIGPASIEQHHATSLRPRDLSVNKRGTNSRSETSDNLTQQRAKLRLGLAGRGFLVR